MTRSVEATWEIKCDRCRERIVGGKGNKDLEKMHGVCWSGLVPRHGQEMESPPAQRVDLCQPCSVDFGAFLRGDAYPALDPF